jgi:hypothetical protein
MDLSSLTPVNALCTSSSGVGRFRSRHSASAIDIASPRGPHRQHHPIEPRSYVFERRLASSQEVFHQLQRLTLHHKEILRGLANEKNQIAAAIARERGHIDAIHQETEARKADLVEILAIMNNASGDTQTMQNRPPSIPQLRRIADAILQQGLLFKRESEKPDRITNEIQGANGLSDPLQEVLPAPPSSAPFPEVMEYQRARLSRLVFKREDVKLQLETIMANRDMLTRTIFDHKTALEALKLKRQNLEGESKSLDLEFTQVLNKSAEILGELAWKNAVVRACNEIASLSKS